jgi:hypothetical protein
VLLGTASTWTVRDGTSVQQGVGISLVGLLVFIAGVILLFTGRYWKDLFDLLLGLHRWIYRVLAYVSLMRDEYPPFRLDLGAVDPGDAAASSSGAGGPGVSAGPGGPGVSAGPGGPDAAPGTDGGPAVPASPEDHAGPAVPPRG